MKFTQTCSTRVRTRTRVQTRVHFARLGLGLGLACQGLGLGLGLGHPEIESVSKSAYSSNASTMQQQDDLNPATAAESVAKSNHMIWICQLHLQTTSRSYSLATSPRWVLQTQLNLWSTCLIVSDELDTDTSCLTFWCEHPKYERLALGSLRALSICIECTSGACLQTRHLHETT